MPTVRSEQRPDKQFSIFACVVAEQCGEPERRIGRILKSEVLGRRRVTLAVRGTTDRYLWCGLCRITMPELSRFYGIIIRMYCEVGPHHSPHFHAYHGDDEAVYGLDPIELLAGSLPRRQARLVEAWAELRQSELLADWNRLQSGTEPLPIDPLP